MSELPRWLIDEEEADAPTSPTPNRRWILAGLAALPWVVVTGLLLSGHLAVPDGSEAAPGRPEQAAETATPETSPTPEPAEPTGPTSATIPDPEPVDDHVPPAQPSSPELEARVGAMAIATARAWLTDVGPQVRIEGLEPRADHYLEQAILETVEVRGSVAVATLLAVVLEREDDRYTDAAVRRLAVPVGLDASEARPAGEPWWLPDPDLEPLTPQLEAVDDPQTALALAEQLTDMGYEDVEVDGLSREVGGWMVADAVARLPDGRTLDGPVWLAPPGEGRDRRESAPAKPNGSHDAPASNDAPEPHAEEQP